MAKYKINQPDLTLTGHQLIETLAKNEYKELNMGYHQLSARKRFPSKGYEPSWVTQQTNLNSTDFRNKLGQDSTRTRLQLSRQCRSLGVMGHNRHSLLEEDFMVWKSLIGGDHQPVIKSKETDFGVEPHYVDMIKSKPLHLSGSSVKVSNQGASYCMENMFTSTQDGRTTDYGIRISDQPVTSRDTLKVTSERLSSRLNPQLSPIVEGSSNKI